MTDIATPPPLENFLASFGEPEKVREDIKRYWKKTNGLPFPIPLYNHLMNQRVAQGKISERRAKYLQAMFAESFAPEPVTGYYPKHREPLVNDLIALYRELMPQRSVICVGADITNLGGLNRDLKALQGKNKHLADAVIRLMSIIVREKLESCGALVAVRHGGDELIVELLPKDGVSITQVHAALNEAQQEIAAFIAKAGLDAIAHTKRDPVTKRLKPPGVGIGLAAQLRETKQSATQQHATMERAISRSKHAFRARVEKIALRTPRTHTLRPDAGAGLAAQLQQARPVHLTPRAAPLRVTSAQTVGQPPVGIDLARLRGQFRQPEYRRFRKPFAGSSPLLFGDGDFNGATPEEARYHRMKRGLEQSGPGRDAAFETKALNALLALTSKHDHVTDMPMFGDMGSELLPHFRQHHAKGNDKITLLHVDFNNMGGGNELGSWVGDAMGKVFCHSIAAAMKNCLYTHPEKHGPQGSLGEFLHYATSQGGGKFALMLPASLTRGELDRLHVEIERQLSYRSQEPLKLTPEQFARSVTIAKQLGDLYPNNKRKQRFSKPNEVTVDDIINFKTRLDGASVVCSSETIKACAVTLGSAMDRLEAKAAGAHKTIDGLLSVKQSRKRSPGAALADKGQGDDVVPMPPAAAMGVKEGGAPPTANFKAALPAGIKSDSIRATGEAPGRDGSKRHGRPRPQPELHGEIPQKRVSERDRQGTVMSPAGTLSLRVSQRDGSRQ